MLTSSLAAWAQIVPIFDTFPSTSAQSFYDNLLPRVDDNGDVIPKLQALLASLAGSKQDVRGCCVDVCCYRGLMDWACCASPFCVVQVLVRSVRESIDDYTRMVKARKLVLQ